MLRLVTLQLVFLKVVLNCGEPILLLPLIPLSNEPNIPFSFIDPILLFVFFFMIRGRVFLFLVLSYHYSSIHSVFHSYGAHAIITCFNS